MNVMRAPVTAAVRESGSVPRAYTERELFYYLIHSDAYPEIVPVAWCLINASLADARGRFGREGRLDDDTLPDSLTLTPRSERATFTTTAGCVELVRQLAPLRLLGVAWLQSISQAATGHLDVHAALFGMYLHLTEGDRGDQRPASLYRALLAHLGIFLPEIDSWVFAQHEKLLDAAFEPAVISLCLGLFPRLLFPEILGFTLAHCQDRAPLSAWSMATQPKAAIPLSYFTLYDRLLGAQRDSCKQAIEQYLRELPGDDERAAGRQRVRTGVGLYESADARFRSALIHRLNDAPDARAQLADLLRRKAPYARGFHRQARLGGEPLDAWFAAEPFDAERFLDELAASSYLDPQQPEASSFFRLLEFGGPMYGVFSEEEQRIFRDWLESIKRNDDTQEFVGDPASCGKAEIRLADTAAEPLVRAQGMPQPATDRLCDKAANPLDLDRLKNREAFYYLINCDRYPDVYHTARRRVARCLRKTDRGTPFQRRDHQEFFPYRPDRFARWLDELYRRQAQAFRPVTPPPRLSREAYRWSIEQFAPAILVDGCWLQNAFRADAGQPDLAERLLRIYADEVGNGDPQRNHANVYRRLLGSLDIHLPAVDSRAFCAHPGFLDAAFDLPVYLMAISLLPREFQPEILGLNLAIELSGLGAGYRRLADEMDYWGIDSSIVRLHQSIDNYATGHAALAKEAVILYLDDALARGGKEDMQKCWRRVWIGYRSLAASVRRFKLGWSLGYARRFLLAKLGTSVRRRG